MSDTDYDRIAPFYDTLLDPFLNTLRRSVRGVLQEQAGERGVASVVDLCCGTGSQARVLREAGFVVSGVDLSSGMLEQARKKSPADIVYHHADATNTGLPAASFDAATMNLALHEMEDPLRLGVLAEAVRLVRPGGVILAADYRQPSSRLAMLPVAFVERLAGRGHYAQFRDFLSRGATRGVLVRAGLAPELARARLSGCVGIYTALLPDETSGVYPAAKRG